jgi:AcrR family transcriptional regulator
MARPRNPEIDRRIIEACVVLLDEVGRHRLTREQIARRAGVSLPAVIRRYDSVDAIILAIARTPPSAAEPFPAVTSLRTFLIASLLRTARAFAGRDNRRAAAELLAAAAGDDRIDDAFRATLAMLRTQGVAWIERARSTGEIRTDVDAETLLDLLAGAAYYPLLWRNHVITTADVEPIVDLILLGATPRDPGPPEPAR